MWHPARRCLILSAPAGPSAHSKQSPGAFLCLTLCMAVCVNINPVPLAYIIPQCPHQLRQACPSIFSMQLALQHPVPNCPILPSVASAVQVPLMNAALQPGHSTHCNRICTEYQLYVISREYPAILSGPDGTDWIGCSSQEFTFWALQQEVQVECAGIRPQSLRPPKV